MSARGRFRPEPREPGDAEPLGAALRLGLLGAVAVLFGVSGGLLWLVGYNYDGLSGSAATKIHPFTYMVTLLFLMRAAAYGNPVAYLAAAANRRPAALLMVVVAVIMVARTALRQAPGMAGFIDTDVGPALLVVLLAEAGSRTMRDLDRLLHGLMTANAVLGLMEFATKSLLFPYRFDGAVFVNDHRSSALQGHPLANALVTAVYVLALLNGARNLGPGLRLGLIALQTAALVAFGGRTASVVVVVFGALYGVGALVRTLRGGRLSLPGAAAGVVLLGLVPVAVAGAAGGGFFDALLGRFVSDGGSANARVEMLAIFDALPLRDILVGPDTGLIESLRRMRGLEWGIENPIVHMVLYQGAILTLLVAAAFTLFTMELARQGRRGSWFPLLGCLILLNTSESISVKTTILAKVAVIVLCLYRQAVSPAAAPARREAARAPAPRPRLDPDPA